MPMVNYRKKKKKLRHEPPLGRTLGRLGIVTRQPLFWAGMTIAFAMAGGPKGRRAAARGVVCYLVGAAVGNLPKPLFGRPQPRHRRAKKPQVIFGAFPSGPLGCRGSVCVRCLTGDPDGICSTGDGGNAWTLGPGAGEEALRQRHHHRRAPGAWSCVGGRENLASRGAGRVAA